ncbi:choice-of-anchor D domain-containing protein [Granulicella sp. WH15]|uniref:choice-of-anchor D domain-containing protein n=1 Tax=Granulicella sp. WH15 TaxID=2602070 RepID=UPI0013671783|nr:choice-of-anchor D domain-containing protein [Granulicella sp. WH15]QHN03510.1 choice-of-anchor D domain-containing protein [Granulicella sp. WH15]
MNHTFLSHLRSSQTPASGTAPLPLPPAVLRPKPPQPQRRTLHLVILVALAILASCCCTPTLLAQKTSYVDANLTPNGPTYIDTVTATVIVRDMNSGTGIGQSGTVTVSVDGGSAKSGTLTNSTAYVNLGTLAIGNHAVTINFSGSTNYTASTTSTTIQVTDAPLTFVGTQGTTLFQSGSVFDVQGVAVDTADNFYIADQALNFIKKEDTFGNVTKLPFTGLNGPTGLALDTAGNLYAADMGNNRILKMPPSGIQTVVTVTGLNGPTWLAYDRSNDILYIADPKNGRIVKLVISTGTQTDVITGLPNLRGIGLTSQNKLLFADHVQGFFEIDTDGTQIPIYASAGFPGGIAGDAFGNIFVSDTGHNILLRIDATGNQVQVNDGGNPVIGMASDSHGRIYLAIGPRVDIVAPTSGRTPDSVVNNGGPTGLLTSLIYQSPQSLPTFTIAAAPAKLFQLDSGMSCYNPTGMCYQYIEPSPQSAGFNEGSFTTTYNGASSTLPLWTIGIGGSAAFSPGIPSQISSGASTIGGVALDIAGDRYVSDTANKTVFKVSTTGSPVKLGFTGLSSPTQVAVDASGAVYVLDTGLNEILRLDPSGTQTVSYKGTGEGTAVSSPTAFALDGDTNLVLGGSGRGTGVVARVVRQDLPPILLPPATTSITLTSSLGTITAVAIDPYENVYALESSGNLWSYSIAGATTQLASGLSGATGFGVDAASNAYVVTANTGNITVVHPDKSTSTLSLNGLYSAVAVAVDSFGDLLVGDGADKQLLFLDRTQQNYIFGNVNLGSSYTLSASVSNLGNQPFIFSGSLPSNGTFAPATSTGECNPAGSPPTKLSPAASCDLSYTFTPPSATAFTYSGSLTTTPSTLFDTTGLGAMQFSGTGVVTTAAPHPILTPSTINFGSLTVGTTSTAQTATLLNSGTAALTITSFGFFGPNTSSFAQTNNCGSTLAAGASCSVAITCTPSASGTVTADLGANFPSPLVQQYIALSCTGASATTATPQAALTPASVNFNSVATGSSSAAQTFTLANHGNAALSISSISLGGTKAFAVGSNNCGASLAAGSSCTISVTFTPSAVGSATATLTIADNAPGSPQSSTLTGTGTASPAAADFTVTATPASQSITSGSSAAYSVNVASTGGAFAQAVALAASGLPAGATVSFSPASVTPGDSAAQSTMTIRTASPQMARGNGLPRWPFTAPVFAALLLLIPGKRLSLGKKSRGLFASLACIVALFGIAVSTTGCGAGFALPSSAKTYTITVTGTSGSDTHSTTVTLTVQ